MTQNPDWVRFSYEIEVKVNDFITAQTNCYGGITTTYILGKEVRFIEDLEVEPTWFVGGEKTNYDGFKELYNKLFKSDYSKLEDELDKFCRSEISKSIENLIDDYSAKDRIKFLKETLSQCLRIKSKNGVLMLRNTWELVSILATFGIPFIESKRFEVANSQDYAYGIPEFTIESLITELIEKYDK